MTDPWVADYTSRIDPAALAAAGVVGVCRYLSRYSWKVISAAEYAELRAAGIAVVLNFEDYGDQWLQGSSAGAADARFAAAAAAAVGYPPGQPIPSSADFDMTSAQWPACRDYATAYRDTLRAAGYRPGVYGSWDVLTGCQGLGYDWFWQSMSTGYSGGRNARPWPGAHLRQAYPQTVGTTSTDHNVILRSDWSDMATIDDLANDMRYLAPRVEALKLGSATVRYGPEEGEDMWAVKQLQQLQAGTPPTQDQITAAVSAVMHDPAWIAALAAALAGHVHVT